MAVSQSYFDETVLENEEVFDLTPEAALEETMDQLSKQQGSSQQQSLKLWKLQHAGLSLTHPNSKQGQWERQQQESFRTMLDQDSWTDETAQGILSLLSPNSSVSKDESKRNSTALMFRQLFWHIQQKQQQQQQQQQQPSDAASDENQPPTCRRTVLNKLADYATSSSNDSAWETAINIALAVLVWQEHAQCPQLSLPLQPSYRQRQEQLLKQFMNSAHGWQRLFHNSNITTDVERHQCQWLQLAFKVCQGHEPNKKLCNSKPVLQVLVETLTKSCGRLNHYYNESTTALATAACQFLTVLCRFDDFSQHATQGQAQDNTGMVVSSAHSTVTTLGTLGIVQALYNLLQLQCSDSSCSSHDKQERLLLGTLTALRSMAIQDDMVQTMLTVGLLDTLHPIFTNYCGSSIHANEEADSAKKTAGDEDIDEENNLKSSRKTTALNIVSAMVGLYRNMSANDAIKTTLCRSPDHSSLGPLIATMQTYLQRHPTTNNATSAVSNKAVALLLEHACATLGSMALRQPQNAAMIIQDFQGHITIIQAMRCFSRVPVLQRQGALALRNLASRGTPEMKQQLLDAGAEDVLRKAGGIHTAGGGAVEEAYAALRDLECSAELLHCNTETGTLQRQPMFGDQPLQFRKVYD